MQQRWLALALIAVIALVMVQYSRGQDGVASDSALTVDANVTPTMITASSNPTAEQGQVEVDEKDSALPSPSPPPIPLWFDGWTGNKDFPLDKKKTGTPLPLDQCPHCQGRFLSAYYDRDGV